MRSILLSLTPIALLTLGCAVDNGTGPRATHDVARDITQLGGLGNKGDVLLKSGGGPAKVYCVGSSCYAVAYEFKDYSGPYTLFTAYFQNLEGTYPSDGPGTQVDLSRFALHFPGSGSPGDYLDALNQPLPRSTIGNVQTGVFNAWSHDGILNPEAGIAHTDVWVASPGSEIVGCNVWPATPDWFSYRTCPSQGIDGWVKLEFVIRRYKNFQATRPPVRLHDFRFSFGTIDHLCTIGGKQPDTCTELPYRRAVRK